MREFSDCSTRIAAAESPVIALAKSRVMPENIYYTARWLRIKTADRRTIAAVYYINYPAGGIIILARLFARKTAAGTDGRV